MYTKLGNSIDLSDQVAIVTGGGTGVGEGITRALLECGAKVVIMGRSDVHQQKADELGESAIFIRGDITSEENCGKVVRETIETIGSLEILVNCSAAKPNGFSRALKENMEEWQQAMDVSLRGTYQMSRAAAAEMAKKKKGAIVNISSIGGVRSFGGDVAYTTSKAAVHMLTKNLATQWGQFGIRVNCLVVGDVDAGFGKSVEMTEEQRANQLAAIPLGYRASAEEMGWPVAFLVSEHASFINGALLVADGGQLAT